MATRKAPRSATTPAKPSRPSHNYHTCTIANLRPVLAADVLPADEYNVKHAMAGLWTLLDRLGHARRPAMVRGDKSWGIEPRMARAEQEAFCETMRSSWTPSANGIGSSAKPRDGS